MRLSIIAAVSENDVIGRDGVLPWHLASDLQRFKQLTMGHAIIMGRRTWESIGRPLPGRTSIVLSRQMEWRIAGALVMGDLDAALRIAQDSCPSTREAFVVGGSRVYSLALPRASRLYLTRVHATIEGDVRFPSVDWDDWNLIDQSYHAADERNEYAHTYEVWHRLTG